MWNRASRGLFGARGLGGNQAIRELPGSAGLMGIRMTRLKSIFARFNLAAVAIGFVGGDLAFSADNSAEGQTNTDKTAAHKNNESNSGVDGSVIH
jgi:hypothetical protein